jgi:hypothetical protein
MKILKNFNLDKTFLRIKPNKKNLFSLLIKGYTTESLEIIQSKADRNSQEFQVKIFDKKQFNRIITKIS